MNRLRSVIQILQRFYGKPTPPKITDAFELILWENVAYLVSDEKRAAAFAALKKSVGTKPQEMLKAPYQQLLAVTKMGGMAAEVRAQRLRQIAEIAHWIFKDDLQSILKKPLAEAKKALKRFPSVGDPGAEKILMLTRMACGFCFAWALLKKRKATHPVTAESRKRCECNFRPATMR